MSIYRGAHYNGGSVVTRDGRTIDIEKSLRVRNHSPSGFSWGYGGSGPAQLALALLMEEFPRKDAERFYEPFKQDVIAKLPQYEDWSLTSQDIQAWMVKASRESANE